MHDPVVSVLPESWSGRVISHARALDAVVGAEVLVVGTEWPEFRQEAEMLLSVASSELVVIDANRHLQTAVASSGLKYVAVGTPLASEN